ncbi:MAG TPA: endolytic transglycosylase MltG [Acidimicrobiales bacterium]|nr:endolytic transglycosylase MltG [Acidimicrobiales bacterium]
MATEVDDDGAAPEWVRRRRKLSFTQRVVLAGVAGVVVLVAAAAVWIDFQVNPPGGPGRTVTVNLPAGSSYSAAADILGRNGVIGSPTLFRLYVRIHGAGTVQAGSYALRRDDSYGNVVGALGRGPTADRVTIPSGATLAEVAARVGRLPGHTAAGFLAAANSGRVRSAFAPPGTTSLEGLIQPASYSFNPNADDLTILGQMVRAFDSKANAMGIAQQAAQIKVTPYQALIVASIVEREAKVPLDQGRVAQVVYNRLAKGMPLQLDSTVIYALGGNVTTLTKPDFSIASPYNTYRVPGLPPTPIANPSDASLVAALNPTPGPWLYFVVIAPDGTEAFSTTLAEQNANIALARQRGLG